MNRLLLLYHLIINMNWFSFYVLPPFFMSSITNLFNLFLILWNFFFFFVTHSEKSSSPTKVFLGSQPSSIENCLRNLKLTLCLSHFYLYKKKIKFTIFFFFSLFFFVSFLVNINSFSRHDSTAQLTLLYST